jgi:TolB protein
MTRRGRLFCGGLALTVALPVLAFAPVPGGDKAEKIVFTSVDLEAKKIGIGIMNADGSQRTMLSKGEALDMDPALSSDGKRIAFATMSEGGKTGDIAVMNADGKERKKLTENKAQTVTFGPSWSPDGKRIAYSRLTESKGPGTEEMAILVMDADGMNTKAIGKGLLPAFSPDGKRILYTGVETVAGEQGGKKPQLRVMEPDGKNDKELVKGPAIGGAWSPDGKKIAYTAMEEKAKGQPHLWVCNADGSEPKQLTKGDDGELAPQWSADGKRLYFSRMSFGDKLKKATICAIDADGKNEKEITKEGMDLVGHAGFFLLFRAVGTSAPPPPPARDK